MDRGDELEGDIYIGVAHQVFMVVKKLVCGPCNFRALH